MNLPVPASNVLFRSRLQGVCERAFPEPRVNLFELGYSHPFETDLPAASETTAEGSLPDAAEDASDANALPVVTAPFRDVRAEAHKLLAPVFEALSKLDVGDNLKNCRGSLQGELTELSEKLGDLFVKAREEKITRLTAEHSASADACRLQQKAVDAAELAVQDFQAEFRKCNSALSLARAKLQSVLESEPSPDTWPTPQQVNRWREQRDAARLAVNVADEARSKCLELDRGLRSVLAAAKEKLSELANVELTLRRKLSGQPWTDVEYGLVHPAEL